MAEEASDEVEWIEEEIDPEEVETFVAVIEELIPRAKSAAIRAVLENACEEIASFVEWEEESEAA